MNKLLNVDLDLAFCNLSSNTENLRVLANGLSSLTFLNSLNLNLQGN